LAVVGRALLSFLPSAALASFPHFDTLVLNPFRNDRLPGRFRPMKICSICSIRHLAALALLMALAATAQSIEIFSLYSNIDSADITLVGGGEGILQMDLTQDNKVLNSRKLDIDGPGTYVVRWPNLKVDKGSYSVCATLRDDGTKDNSNDDAGEIKDGAVQSRRCYRFYYGGVEPVRFDVRDFRSDSRGLHLAISASDPTIVDIYYMLVQGDRALYVTRERAVPISGLMSMAVEKDYKWKPILENGQTYEGRVKIVELNHNQTRAFMNPFVAIEDAQITETYQDETGASATVMGDSRVPFEGLLRFTLSGGGEVLNITEKKTPVLLSGDDETVEITWNSTLEPGVYQLQTALIGQDGSIVDLQENIIEAKPIVVRSNADETKSSGLPAGLAGVAMLAIILFRRMRRQSQLMN
jgi:hypothetical protein